MTTTKPTRAELWARAIKGIPTDMSPVHYCPVCHNRYASHDDAVLCSKSNIPTDIVPGQIVRIDIGYSWYDGKKEWMLLHEGYEFHGNPTHAAYFIVTSVDYGNQLQSTYERHKPRFSVRTLGIKNGMPGGLHGWVTTTHYAPKHVDQSDPLVQRLKAEAAEFIGDVYVHLL